MGWLVKKTAKKRNGKNKTKNGEKTKRNDTK
jgi:hypothetical protein